MISPFLKETTAKKGRVTGPPEHQIITRQTLYFKALESSYKTACVTVWIHWFKDWMLKDPGNRNFMDLHCSPFELEMLIFPPRLFMHKHQ